MEKQSSTLPIVSLENLKTSEGKGIILSLILLRCPFLSVQ
jgi:hypothetical protein